MIVSYNLPNINKYNNTTPSFHGHAGSEFCSANDLGFLIHETGFFRDHKSNKFLKNFLLKNKSSKDKIRILSLGCSTGEEAVTQSMMLDSIKDRVEILGIDLSKESVAKATSRKYTFERPDIKYLKDDEIARLKKHAAYNDSFLAFKDEAKNLSEEDKEKQEMFNNFFGEDYSGLSKLQRFKKKLFKFISEDPFSRRKTIKLKDGKATNCKFQQGDILDIDKYSQDKKADVILFKNTLYHLTTTYDNNLDRVAKSNAAEIIENVCSKLKKALTKDGIMFFGENEEKQLVLDKNVVPGIMKKIGFKPLNETKSKPANIWQINN